MFYMRRIMLERAAILLFIFSKGPNGLLVDATEGEAMTACASRGIEVIFVDLMLAISSFGAFGFARHYVKRCF